MTIICGDCLEVMKTFPDNHFSAIVTDPPYGLSFMGKGWDHVVPKMSYWKEAIRIAKPGSFSLVMGGSRTFHRVCCEIEDAGWEIRDCLAWLYGSGFPKSHNHFGIPGQGTALKPAWEPIIMAMKPCDGTFKQNVEKWGQAGINIDGSRIGSDGATKRSHQSDYPKNEDGTEDRTNHWARVGHSVESIEKGRWPANIIFDEEAAKMLDEQTGNLKSGQLDRSKITAQNKTYGNRPKQMNGVYEQSSGGASRFFYCAKTSSRERNEGLEGLPDHNGSIHLDGGPWEKNKTSSSGEQQRIPRKNNHPTVKPLKLMEYLIKLVMPPSNGILLDPFAGSGTTILAAKRLGFEAIGIEKEPEYCEIARKRLENEEICQDLR